MQNLSDQTAILKREDLMAMEGLLYSIFSPFLPDMNFSLFFPRRAPENMCSGDEFNILEEKDRILMPLVQDKNLLAIMVAKRKDQKEPGVLKNLQPILNLCLETLRLHKAQRTDPLTGLNNQNTFLAIAGREIEQICSGLDSETNGWPENGFKATFSILVAGVDNLRHINNRYGFTLGDDALKKTAESIKSVAPDHAIIARLDGSNEIALLLPNTNQRGGTNLAREITSATAEIKMRTPLTKERLTLTVSVGLASFPQDINGPANSKAAEDIARNVVEKAKTARNYAYGQTPPLCAFRQILRSGGRIAEALPLGRVLVDIGRFAGAREGQRFLVSSNRYGPADSTADRTERPSLPKAEVVLVDVRDREAMGEVLQLNDPSWQIAPGDSLTLLPPDREFSITDSAGRDDLHPRRDPLTGLHTLRDFLSSWDRLKNEASRFSLILIRYGENGPIDNSGYSENQSLKKMADKISARLPENSLGGRYGSTSLIFFVPEQLPEDVQKTCLELEDICNRELQMRCCMGIAGYPFLDHSRSAALQNLRKALEHSLLLSVPRVAALNSVSFNISADRFFAEGDLFAAMEEYKTSLTLDADNHLARNSLGICYARLGMLQEANSCFRETVSRSPDNSMAWYNLGCVCMRQNEIGEAGEAFEKVLQLEPEQIFCLFRLGMLAEKQKDLKNAGKYYEKAQNTEQGKKMASRHLARVAFKRGDLETARELLHHALVTYPRDAHSLHLLARIYLNSGDDPEMAEMLARQSASIAPENRDYLETLIQVLKMQGKTEEIEQARFKADNL